jgi:hypothetical protein
VAIAPDFGLTARELRAFKALRTPQGVQKFLDSMPYHLAMTAWSPRRVLHERTAHCLEGAIFGAAALRVLGYPPLLLDLEADKDTDHVIAVFQVDGCWGAVAKSNYTGCRYREPIHRTIRELALSYFEGYFDPRGNRTLRRYSRPINLRRFDSKEWMTTNQSVWFIAEYLVDVPHVPLLTKGQVRQLTRMDKRSLRAGLLGFRRHKK